MKKYTINIHEIYIYLFVALAVGIFQAIPFGWGPNLDSCRNILTAGTIICICFYFLFLKQKKLNNYSNVLDTYMRVYITVLVFIIIRSVYMYNYSLGEIYYSVRQYVWVLLAYPILHLFVRYDSIDRVLNNIVNITLLSLALRFLTWALYKYAGANIFPNLLYEYGISWGRNGILRIDATPLISLVVVFEFYLYTKTKKRKHLLLSICSVVYVAIVSQTRTLIISCLACFLIMFLFKRRKKTSRFFIQSIACCVLAVSVSLGAFDKILGYLNLNSGAKGFGYRYYEFNYYWSLLKDNWKLGMGILSTKNNYTDSLLYGNLDTTMYLDDLGIFGCFFEFGLLSILLYGVLYFLLIKTIIKCYKHNEMNYAIFVLGIFSYLVICSVPLNLFGIQRLFSLPFILASVSFINRKLDII